MTEKRKHDSKGPEQTGQGSEDGQSTSPQEVSATVENYPRKRIAIAVRLQPHAYLPGTGS